MTYENRELAREKRYTIRAQNGKEAVIKLAAELTGVQPSTFIYEAALQRGEEVIRLAQQRQGQTVHA